MSENLNKKPPKGILKQSSSFDKKELVSNVVGSQSRSGSIVEELILSEVSSEHRASFSAMSRKATKFDEMNILETLHPPDKDYGHMKIEEPKTPFNYYEDGEDGEGQDVLDGASRNKKKGGDIDPMLLASRIQEQSGELPKSMQKDVVSDEDDDEDDADLDPESLAKKNVFESKRKAHYNEYYAVKLARKLMEQEDDDDDDEEDGDTANKSTEEAASSAASNSGSDSRRFIPEEETAVADEISGTEMEVEKE